MDLCFQATLELARDSAREVEAAPEPVKVDIWNYKDENLAARRLSVARGVYSGVVGHRRS